MLTLRRAALAAVLLTVVAACRAASADDTAPEPAGALPRDITPAVIALGDSLFNNGACRRCHGNQGAGGNNGPSLTTGAWLHGDGGFNALVATITNGVPREQLKDTSRRFAMNPRGGPMNLTDEQVRAMAGYVYSISRAKTR